VRSRMANFKPNTMQANQYTAKNVTGKEDNSENFKLINRAPVQN
jgi:hypothetical protein